MATSAVNCTNEWDLEGDYRLDAEWRIARRLATLQKAEQSLAYDRHNAPPRVPTLDELAGDADPDWVEWVAQTVDAEATTSPLSLDERAAEIDRLRPYWGDGVTKEQAVAAYEAANLPAA
jgi:hypothetical protein